MMVYNTQNYRGSGLCPSSGILGKTIQKLDLCLSLGEGRKTPTLLGLLERV
jgi:hypothetical protein